MSHRNDAPGWLHEALHHPDMLHTPETITPGTVWRSGRRVYVTLPGGALFICAGDKAGGALNYLHPDAWDGAAVIFDPRTEATS
jgi:hypothetical protein